MRRFRLLSLLMLLTLTCATTGASTLTETSYITQPKHHKKHHHKAPPHKNIITKAPCSAAARTPAWSGDTS